jgi:hypothetical protein
MCVPSGHVCLHDAERSAAQTAGNGVQRQRGRRTLPPEPNVYRRRPPPWGRAAEMTAVTVAGGEPRTSGAQR